MLPSRIAPPLLTSMYSLVEAGISVVVASMPSAAKIWKCHIVESSLYNFIRSRFPETRDPTIRSMSSDLKAAKAKASKAQRRGLYSIPTLLTSIRSIGPTLHTPKQESIANITTNQEMIENFVVSPGNNFASSKDFSLELNGPSGFCRNSSIV
jgi:hypothetical protein